MSDLYAELTPRCNLSSGSDHHIPVLVNEIVEFFQLKPRDMVIDATVGGGGHSAEFLKRTAPDGLLLAIDRDREMLKIAKKRLSPFKDRIRFVCGNYADIYKIAKNAGFLKVDAILFDCGLSSYHLLDQNRGFSFQIDAPLDMRFDKKSKITAEFLLNKKSPTELEKIFRQFGQEKDARKIASLIAKQRKIKPYKYTKELVETILQAKRGRYIRSIHPATLVFQALRIVVNDELSALEKGIRSAVELLKSGGKIAVISFHSLEDRIVKNIFKELSRKCTCPENIISCKCGAKQILKVITEKPITPSKEERKANPRSRSAKLRVAERI